MGMSPQDPEAAQLWLFPFQSLELPSPHLSQYQGSGPKPGFCGSPSFCPSPCHTSWSHHTQPMPIGGLRGCLHLPRSGTTAPLYIYRPCPHLHCTNDGAMVWVLVTSQPPHQRGLLTGRATNVDMFPSGTTYF
ncbi:hypothetical protein P7K49_014895 [Saguinus oedipus]|uniref:Uncharacterized protein n=1 Tax=Saguinus oedipus TaxID=9490 RepID=A0ABQ9V8A4_SAGOE|nr:hypothetical protein P7K49_014895 [Saguinus oedipus]